MNASHAKAVVEERPTGAERNVADSSKTIAAKRICRIHDVRIGFDKVKGLGDEEAKAIVAERETNGPYRGFDEFASRVGLKEEPLRNLATGNFHTPTDAAKARRNEQNGRGHIFGTMKWFGCFG